MDCCPSGSSVHGDSPGKNIQVGCPFLLQRIFLTQGSNVHLKSPALVGRLFTTSTTSDWGSSYTLISMSEIEFLWCVCVCVCVCVNIFELFENDIGGRNESKLLALVNFLVPKTEFKIYSK